MRSDVVASIIRPLTASDGHTGRAVKSKMTDMHIAYPGFGAETRHHAAKSAMTA